MILGSGRNCQASGLTFTELGPAGEAGLRPASDNARTQTQSRQGSGWTRCALHEALPTQAAAEGKTPSEGMSQGPAKLPGPILQATSCARSTTLSETPRNLCTHTDVLFLKDLIQSNRSRALGLPTDTSAAPPPTSFLPSNTTHPFEPSTPLPLPGDFSDRSAPLLTPDM